MPESPPCSLIPEQHLTAPLSPLWQRRFNRAIDYLNQTIGQSSPPSWDQVAAYSAISPFHFHRMFTVVFKETPGQYVRRMRLQSVIYSLINEPKKAVTEIALGCGFSSSQSLAKALRRELNTSAKTIRNGYLKEGWETIELLLKQLGQPETRTGSSLEKSMAGHVQFQVLEEPEQYFFVKQVPLKETSIVHIVEEYETGHDVYAFIKIPDADKAAENLVYQVGYKTLKNQANFTLPAGKYLSCRVLLNNMVAYAAIWDALYIHLLSLEFELDPKGYAIEVFHQNPDRQEGMYEITLTLALAVRQTG